MFVPRGVGNAFQTLEDETVYSYLVNDHWSPAAKDSYTFVNLADETLAIDWPIPLDQAELSAADLAHPAAGRRDADGAPADVDRRRAAGSSAGRCPPRCPRRSRSAGTGST